MRVQISDPRFVFDQQMYARFLQEQGFTQGQMELLTILVGPFSFEECRQMEIPMPPLQSVPFGYLGLNCSLIINTCAQLVPAASITYELLELTHEYWQYLKFVAYMVECEPKAVARAWKYVVNPDNAYEFADYHLNQLDGLFTLKQPATV